MIHIWVLILIHSSLDYNSRSESMISIPYFISEQQCIKSGESIKDSAHNSMQYFCIEGMK